MADPRQIGRYEILEPIGRGGMGVVYKARDPALQRVVAVKVMGGLILGAPHLRDEYLERFQREARAAARLSHPHIVTVHDFGVDEATGLPFLVMEHVEGASLAGILRDNPRFPLARSLEILDQVASALTAGHAAGVVHRDIKPDNVLLDAQGQARVTDFGIARVEGSELTQTGVGLGTPGYLPPEGLQGAPPDARTDVFALGALAYQLVTGRKAFSGPTRDSVGLQVLNHQPVEPHVLCPEVPPHVSRAVMHALAKSPDERTPTAAAFREELRSEHASDAAVPPTVTISTAARRPGARRFLLPALAALLAAAAVPWALHACRDETPAGPAAAATATPTPRPKATARAAPPPATTLVVTPARVDRRPPPEAGDDGPGKGQGPSRGRGHGQKKPKHGNKKPK